MLAPIFVVILTVIYVKYLKVEISLKVQIPRNNTVLCGHSNCDICKISESADQFEGTVTKR